MSGEKFNGNESGNFGLDSGPNGLFLPVNIFSKGASGLESISQYLKDGLGLRYCEIASLLNRDDRTIWGAHHGAMEKVQNCAFDDSSIKIPISIFQDRMLSVLEAIAEYMKEDLNMKYSQIAAVLNKDQRTIWTVYRRAKKKRKNEAN